MSLSVSSSWRPTTAASGSSAEGVRSTPEQRKAQFEGATDSQLAAATGLPLPDLRALVTTGGLLTLPPSSRLSALTGGRSTDGLPMTGTGVPDFEKIREAGGRVSGALPPLPPGSESFTIISDLGTTSYFAAEVDLNDGQGPRYVKGATYLPNPNATPAMRHRAIAEVAHYFARLPEDMDTARRNGMANIFDSGADGSSITARA